MAVLNLPPPPTGQNIDSWQWRDWFYRLISAFVPSPGGGGAGDGIAGQVLVSGGLGNVPVWTTARMEQTFTGVLTVTVTHNFGARPWVQVLDTTNAIMIPMSVTHSSVNVFVVSFSIPTTGTILAGLF